MGQPVAVEEKPGHAPAVVRFETNRSLTGQGHESFARASEARGNRPAAVLAARLFGSGQVSRVHVYGNIVTATLAPGATQAGLDAIVRDLYQYWKPGMQPPSVEELMAQVPKSAAPAATGDSGAPASSDPNLAKIPPALLARSQAALAKARAKQG